MLVGFVGLIRSDQVRIINCVCFESIHYVINLDDVSSSKVYSEFDYVFSLNVLLI